jgi:uncharacterized sulfatase
MDERPDLSRAVRDKHYLYIRNYMPHRPQGQYLAYMFKTPTTRVWKKLFDQGRLQPPQTYFWERKSSMELYDLDNDPEQIHNLAGQPGQEAARARLDNVLHDHLMAIRDISFLPEAEMKARTLRTTPYDLAQDERQCPLSRILKMAEMASSLDAKPASGTNAISKLKQALDDPESGVRYWAALGLLMRGQVAVDATVDRLRGLLDDRSPSVRIVAADALARFCGSDDLQQSLTVLVDLADVSRHGVWVAMAALNVLDELDERCASVADSLRDLPATDPAAPARYRTYPARIRQSLFDDLD